MPLARLFAACLLALVLVALPQRAGAAMMRHHDLASLALDSEAVVLARRVRSEKRDYDTLVHHEIIKVYRGDLAVGDPLVVSYSAYNLSPDPWRRSEDPPAGLSDQVVLFLRHWSKRPEWSITASGLRVLIDGHVHRFEQFNNPGLYHPTPQGRDPYDVMRDPRAGASLDLPAFEQELARALRHADIVRHALTDARSPAGKQRLLDLVGPAPGTWDDRPFAPSHTGFWDDLVATTILETLARTGDITDLLTAATRVRGGVDMFMLSHPYEPAELLAHATTSAVPPAQRVAALILLDQELAVRDDPEIVAGVIPLLADPDPKIRAAAARMSLETDPWKTALVDRFTHETDGGVRHELARAADTRDIFDRLRLPATDASARIDAAPLLIAERHGAWLMLRWLPNHWRLEEVALSLEQPGEPPQRTILPKKDRGSLWSWASGKATGHDVLLPLTPQPGVAPVPMFAELRMHLDGRRKPQTFRIPVPALTAVATPAFPDPPPRTTPISSSPPPATAPPPAAPSPAIPPGCTCNALPAAAPLMWLFVLATRRRRRAA
jgi:hypothetical protein